MELIPIGEVIDGYPDKKSAPKQGRFDRRISKIRIYDKFLDGLEGINDYKHIIILYWLHLSKRNVLKAKPPEETKERGVFSTRSPERPNPIGFAIVELVDTENGILTVRNLDAVTGTPVIDMKPFLKEVDCVES